MGICIECIDHVTLPVMYLKRSVAFYRDVLGLEPVPLPQSLRGGAWFRIGPGNQQLHLRYRLDWRGDAAADHRHFALRVADLAAAQQHLTSAGWPFREGEPLCDGAGRIFLKDPDGHTVELCQPRGAT